MECSAVEWSGMESMECSAVECSGMESMECSAVEWNVREKIDLLFFGQSDNFHFSKVAHFFSFCEARSKMVSNQRRATKCHVLKIAFVLGVLIFVFRFKGCF